jgi:serine/threonine-protein kinase RsbW
MKRAQSLRCDSRGVSRPPRRPAAAANGKRADLLGTQPPLQLCRTIHSRLEEVNAVCLRVRALLSAAGLQKKSFVVELMTRECLNNAVLHGNKGNRQKQVGFTLSCGRSWICVQIADEGEGFNWRRARREPVDWSSTSGRGLSIVRSFADEVRFNRRGNQITFRLRRKPTTRGK